jgi:UDP-2,3-diacylglucosamine pyrophosphatase LpxH
MSKRDLDKLVQSSSIVNFDDNTKLVFISDVHRGDGTYFDSLLPNENIYFTALKYYFKNDFTYVEVGDGDELWKNKNYNEIAYIYEEVFRLFNKFNKDNRLYMIYGNHDIMKKNKSFKIKQEKALRKIGADYGVEFLKLISNTEFYSGINFNYTPLKEKFLVTHGHQLDLINCELDFISRFLVRYIWKFLSGLCGIKDPTSSAKSKTTRSGIDIKLQDWTRDNYKMLLCGHTHNSRFPEIYEIPYFNDGCCVLPYAMTAIEVEAGNIALVKWSVDAKDTGVLWVKRKVIGGPQKISYYLLWAREARLKANRKISE